MITTGLVLCRMASPLFELSLPRVALTTRSIRVMPKAPQTGSRLFQKFAVPVDERSAFPTRSDAIAIRASRALLLPGQTEYDITPFCSNFNRPAHACQ